MTKARHVTDHAVIRYLELAYGFNVDFFRNRIDVLTKNAVAADATGVVQDGVKFVIRHGKVTDVKKRSQRSCHRSGRLEEVLRNLEPVDPELAELMIIHPGEKVAAAE